MREKSNADLSIDLRDSCFKDDSPLKTVERIKEILKNYGIKTVEKWNESGVEYCHSLRVSIEGTVFGANGKGLTKEFALASAYGELIERVQLGLFGDSSIQKLGIYSNDIETDEFLTIEQLLDEMPSWYEYLSLKAQQLDYKTADGHKILSRFTNADGKIACMKFYNLMNGKATHIPRELCGILYGSSGGAAGNTMEEAVVQALSEIVERHYKQRIIDECISLPDIPEDVLKKYTVAYNIISTLRDKGFRVIVKDCSLGEKFPVVCICYIHKETGRYHTHFGAYPVFEIALERTLTESFQGRNIESFTGNEDFIYNPDDSKSYRSVYNELKKGSFDKTVEFFIGECKYQYNENVGFNGNSNKELLPQLISFFDEHGYEINVYDSSCFGFPTYKVIIPKYSEIIFHGLSEKENSFKNVKIANKVLRDPTGAEFDDYLLLLMHISEMKKLGKIYRRLFTFSTCANLAMQCDSNQDSYFMSASLGYVYYEMGNQSNALSYLNSMIPFAKKESIDFLLCLKRYLSMALTNHTNEQTKSLLSLFHKEETVDKLFFYLESGKNPFYDFVLHCDLENCNLCIANEVCRQKYTSSLISLVRKKTENLNFKKTVELFEKYLHKK